jgi:hypothetical protein
MFALKITRIGGKVFALRDYPDTECPHKICNSARIHLLPVTRLWLIHLSILLHFINF